MKRAFLTILTVCLLLTLALSAANADSLKGGKEKTSAVLLSTKDYAKFIEPYFSMNTFALGSYQQDWYYLVAPSDGEYTFSFKKQAGSWILAVYKDPQGIVDQIEITENRELYKIKAKKGEEIYLGFYINIGYIDFNAGGDFSVCFDGYHNVHETRYTLEEALCEKEGTIVTGTCSICGQITATETIPATGHTPGKEVVLTEPTCIQEGLKGIQCTVCKTVLSSEKLPMTDHKPGEWSVLTQPTCTEEGIRARTCSVCGEVLEMGVVPALGHSFGGWTVTQMPTATEPGIQSRTCSRCGETEMKALVLQTSGDQEQTDISKENNTTSANDEQEGKTEQIQTLDADLSEKTVEIEKQNADAEDKTTQIEALNVEAKDDSKEIPSEIIAENSPAPILTNTDGVTRAGTFVPGFTLTPEELGEKCEMLVNRINNETWKNIPIDLHDFPIQIDPTAIFQTLIPEIVAGEKGNRTIKLPYFTDNGWVLSVPTKGEQMWLRQENGYLREGDDWYDVELCFRGIFEYYTEKGTLKFYLDYDENLTLQSFSIDYRPSTDNREMQFSYRSSRPLLTIISNEAWFDVSFFSYGEQINLEFGFEVEYDLDGKMVQLATEKAVKTETYSAERSDTYSVNEIKKLQGIPAKPIPGFAVDPDKAKEVLSIVAEEAPFWTDTTAPQTLDDFPLLPTMDITVSPPLNIIETDDSVIIENLSVIPLTAGLLSGYRKNGMRFEMTFVSRIEPNESLYLSKEDNDIGEVDSCVMYALYSFDREDFDYSINWGSGYINSISYMLTKDRNESLDVSYLSLWCDVPGHNVSISWDYSPFNGYYHINIRIDRETTVELDYDIETLKLLSIKIQKQ